MPKPGSISARIRVVNSGFRRYFAAWHAVLFRPSSFFKSSMEIRDEYCMRGHRFLVLNVLASSVIAQVLLKILIQAEYRWVPHCSFWDLSEGLSVIDLAAAAFTFLLAFFFRLVFFKVLKGRSHVPLPVLAIRLRNEVAYALGGPILLMFGLALVMPLVVSVLWETFSTSDKYLVWVINASVLIPALLLALTGSAYFTFVGVALSDLNARSVAMASTFIFIVGYICASCSTAVASYIVLKLTIGRIAPQENRIADYMRLIAHDAPGCEGNIADPATLTKCISSSTPDDQDEAQTRERLLPLLAKSSLNVEGYSLVVSGNGDHGYALAIPQNARESRLHPMLSCWSLDSDDSILKVLCSDAVVFIGSSGNTTATISDRILFRF